MEWVVRIQVDADACIFYAHMDDLKRCAPPDPTPSWPSVARGTSIVLSTRTPSTTAPTIPDPSPAGSDSPPMAMSDQSTQSDDCGDGDARAPPITVHTENSPADTGRAMKKQFGICKMKTAYCCKTLNAALTLRVFDFTQWKHYGAPWNLKC